jgi:dTDP-4-amino-4,6-dideoxygalactose transaminase
MAEKFYSEEISLPIHFGLSTKDQEDTTRILLSSLGYK